MKEILASLILLRKSFLRKDCQRAYVSKPGLCNKIWNHSF